MSKFNFNEILLSAKANISKIMENFTKVEDNALASSDIVDNLTTEDATKVLSAKQGKILYEYCQPRGAFIVLRGTISISAGQTQTKTISKPTEFAEKDCVVISCGLTSDELGGSSGIFTYILNQFDNFPQHLGDDISVPLVKLEENVSDLRLTIKNPDTRANINVRYKIVLMLI